MGGGREFGGGGKPDICFLLDCKEKSKLKTLAEKKEDNISDIKYIIESILNIGAYNCATVRKEMLNPYPANVKYRVSP
jgi:hypothetical protein